MSHFFISQATIDDTGDFSGCLNCMIRRNLAQTLTKTEIVTLNRNHPRWGTAAVKKLSQAQQGSCRQAV